VPERDDLVRELRELAENLKTQPTDVRAAVRDRLAANPVPGRFARRPVRRWWPAAAAILVAAALLLVPPVRGAAAEAAAAVLRFAGIVVDTTPGAAPTASPGPLPSPGTVTLDEARRRAAFPIGVPAELGPPERVETADPAPGGAPRVVTLLYRDGAIRLDQFDGGLDPFFLKKLFVQGMSWTDVNGLRALWIPGPHTVAYVGRDGRTRTETARLAGATLIWQRGAVTLRLEGDLTEDEALRIARSVRG
jgi:hypothetical protein